MAGNRYRRDTGSMRILVAVLTILVLVSAASAQTQAGITDSDSGEKSQVGYYHETDEKGNVAFTQILSWDEDANALQFEVFINDASGKELVHKITTEHSLSLQLSPGTYSYNIVTWNLLEQPEEESGFLPLVIVKAERPKLTGTSPSSIYIESLDGRITLKGEKLVSGARYFLRDAEGHEFEGKEISRPAGSEKEVVISFPDRAYQPGTFDIMITNPGGLADVAKNAVHIKYQRAEEMLLSLGYSPVSFFADNWFKSNWREPVYWKGANGALSLYFIKRYWGLFGAEAATSFHRLTGGTDEAKLTSDYLLGGVNFIYKYKYLRNVHFVARAGGGLSFSKHSFDYSGTAGPEMSSTDPYLDMGLSVQYFLPHNFFTEFGANWIEIFEKGHCIGGIEPSLKVGYLLY